MSENTAFSETLAVTDDGWCLLEQGWDYERSVAVGSNFMVGSGFLGYRGTAAEQGPQDFVALVVSDTYDCADGRWRGARRKGGRTRSTSTHPGLRARWGSFTASLECILGGERRREGDALDDAALRFSVYHNAPPPVDIVPKELEHRLPPGATETRNAPG